MKRAWLAAVVYLLCAWGVSEAQETVLVRFNETDEVLINPGIGFNTFQRFNGDTLNGGSGWTEGFPIEYQKFDGDLTNPDHPATTTAYFRVYWKFLEPEDDKYNWEMIDKALRTAAERGQTLLLRIAPYGTGPERDVPDWVRTIFGPEKSRATKDVDQVQGEDRWRVSANDQRYLDTFTDMIRDLGARYDGHPDLELVDMALCGYWGEGAGSSELTDHARRTLVDAYLEAFPKTHKVMLLSDEKTNRYGRSNANVGWRVDCLGDLGFWAKEQAGWTHMYDYYPQGIINFGMEDAWKTAPVSLEICGTMLSWRDKQGYGPKEVKYIFDQALKWHISSFNAKSSAVPKEWWPLVNDWLKKMGYRFVLRKFTYPSEVRQQGKLAFTSWWENTGVSPAYRDWPVALRLKSAARTEVLVTDSDIRKWLPGDALFDSAVFVPLDMPIGEYELSLAIVEPNTRKPHVRLAIPGRDSEGWYPLGKIKVTK